MKLVSTIIFFSLAMILPTACGSTAVNVNTAANTAANRAGNAANSVANVVGNAANTISNAASSMTTEAPNDFMMAAAHGGMAEVEMGKLAVQKAVDPEVRKFGQLMVDDHSRVNSGLKALAERKSLTLPADLGKHQPDLDKLKNLSGAEFDKAYVKLMLDDHEDDVSEFQSQADKSADADVKAFAAKTVPVLKKHLESIRSIAERILK